ncbi:MAG: Hsp20/alpha crystallin family protein [Jatrophihabitans sp.]|nr:MAG: Hsp20/alpha crystallin family protein [Jatrophihabitans sp.]
MSPVLNKQNAPELAPWGTPEAFPWNTRFGHLIDTMWQNAAHGADFPPNGDLEELEDTFVLDVDLPGVDRKDLTVDVSGRRVTISGTRVERERDGILRHSTRVTGAFRYEVVLPATVDEKAVSAKLADGVLTLRLPKVDGARSTHVPIE